MQLLTVLLAVNDQSSGPASRFALTRRRLDIRSFDKIIINHPYCVEASHQEEVMDIQWIPPSIKFDQESAFPKDRYNNIF